jgi:UDP:flavonoid glycosyltransferase YjiC (YdhE family)
MVAPLDWGLGHATRCVPVIEGLLARGAEVVLGSAGTSLEVLKAYYPDLPILELPSYRIRYGKGNGQLRTLGRLGRQIPQVFRAIREEHEVLKGYVKKEGLDICISDHRLGMWHPEIPSYVIAHQVAIQPPPFLGALRGPLFHRHWKYLDRFDQIWVPDFPRPHDLSGDLVPAHLSQNPKVRHVGPLSRFASLPLPAPEVLEAWQTDLAIVLSGPEPQRSLLEAKLLREAQQLDQDVILVQGVPGEKREAQSGNVRLISFLGAEELGALLRQAKAVVSRSGYSSLLDYAALGLQQVALVPTPGQTEQEYLGKRLHQKQIAYSQSQRKFSLSKALAALPQFQGFRQSQHSIEPLNLVLDELFVRNHLINS